MVPRCCRPPGAAPSPPPHRPDGQTVTMVITAPTLQPAVTPAMATPSGTTKLPPPLLPAKQMTRDRRTTTAAATTGTTTRTVTSGGGKRSSTHPPPRCPRSLATLSAMPLLRPAHCCRASRCPGSTSDTATPWGQGEEGHQAGLQKMTAEEKNDLMRKLAELDMEDANDNESTPPSPTPV